jgi:hypothetical protein
MQFPLRKGGMGLFNDDCSNICVMTRECAYTQVHSLLP